MWMVALRWLPKAFEMMDPPVGTAGWLALAAMSAILSLFWSVPIVLAREFANRNPGSQLLATSSLFALGEWARSTSIIGFPWNPLGAIRSEEHTSELQSLMRTSYAVFCLNKKSRDTHKYDRQDNIRRTRQ